MLVENSLSRQKRHQKGQTLVEFMLLLVVVTSAAYIFMSASNKGLAKYWQAYARLIVDDPAQSGVLTIQ